MFLRFQSVDIDTTNILFIASGAFSNLEQIVARRLDKRVLGFGATFTNIAEDLHSSDETIASEKCNELLKQVDPSDLMQFGMVPELVGRFPVLVPFHALDEKMLIRVLQEPRNNLILQAQRFFAMDKMKLRKAPMRHLNLLCQLSPQKFVDARSLEMKVIVQDKEQIAQSKHCRPGKSSRSEESKSKDLLRKIARNIGGASLTSVHRVARKKHIKLYKLSA
ncbi:unnamed protein product [Heligmosomoides polygyrus]|uniref:ATPase_AAA_core domain-containing protein n=1 Tax=Heligmosomoides polygyrus TaxID=6339 RepID=A0A183GDF2_HELPZ|nr:unnamed protein product [Heligmosomoides polygyrus]